MKLLPISEITIPEGRQRQDFSSASLAELRESIQAFGLLHPIVVRKNGADRAVSLVAGERRLRAITEAHFLNQPLSFNSEPIPDGYIPTVTLGELSPLDAEAAELDENIQRADLTWQERTNALGRLHALRVKQAEAAGLPAHTISMTAEEIHGRSDGDYHNSVNRAVLISRHLDDPIVQKAKSVDDAFKALRRKESAEKNIALAAEIGKTLTRHKHSAYLANSLDWMAGQPEGQFDCILTDPPYGIDAQDFGDGAGKLAGIEHHYDDSYENWSRLMALFARQAYRLTKPQAHLYICCDIDRFVELRELCKAAGFWVHRTPIIRHISDGARVPWPDHGPRRAWEMILYAVKGKRPTLSIQPDLILGVQLKEATYGHAAQKPISLFSNLLSRTCRPGDRVLDPFAGTGTIFPAAHSRGLIATGVEMNPEYYGICLSRLGELE